MTQFGKHPSITPPSFMLLFIALRTPGLLLVWEQMGMDVHILAKRWDPWYDFYICLSHGWWCAGSTKSTYLHLLLSLIISVWLGWQNVANQCHLSLLLGGWLDDDIGTLKKIMILIIEGKDLRASLWMMILSEKRFQNYSLGKGFPSFCFFCSYWKYCFWTSPL